MKTVTVVLNGFRRQKTLREQIKAFKSQSHPVKKIMYWNLKSDDPTFQPDYNLLKEEGIEYAETSHDYGTWGRFSFALNSNTDFICMYDDDIVPGERYIENCVTTFEKKPAILGTMGSVISQETGQWIQFGWRDINNNVPVEVMYLYQTHFFPREVLQAFWAEVPEWELVSNRHLGEDVHIAYVAQKYFNLPAVIVPHPHDDKSLWGNIVGDRYGEDEYAIHLSPIQPNMIAHLNQMIHNYGFKIPSIKSINEALKLGRIKQ